MAQLKRIEEFINSLESNGLSDESAAVVLSTDLSATGGLNEGNGSLCQNDGCKGSTNDRGCVNYGDCSFSKNGEGCSNVSGHRPPIVVEPGNAALIGETCV